MYGLVILCTSGIGDDFTCLRMEFICDERAHPGYVDIKSDNILPLQKFYLHNRGSLGCMEWRSLLMLHNQLYNFLMNLDFMHQHKDHWVRRKSWGVRGWGLFRKVVWMAWIRPPPPMGIPPGWWMVWTVCGVGSLR